MAQHWLRLPSVSAVRLDSQEFVLLGTGTGVPQGDPMSVMAFCLSMKGVSKDFWDLLQEQLDAPDDACRLLGYVDDYIIAIAPGYERLVMDTWSQALRQHGFSLNPSKTQIWAPTQVGPCDAEFRHLWLTQERKDGITLCGAPVTLAPDSTQADLQTIADSQDLLPHGQDAYVQHFLRVHTDCVLHKLRALECMSALVADQAGAIHVITHILRVSVLAQSVHIMRAISPRLLIDFMQEIDDALLPLLCRLWRLPALTAAQVCILRAPVTCGGFGFTSLAQYCHLIYAAGFLARRFECNGCLHNGQSTCSPLMEIDPVPHSVTPWCADEIYTLQAIERMMEFSVTGALDVTADSLQQGVRHSLARFRNQVHLRNTVVYQTAIDAKELAPVLTRSSRIGKTHTDQVFSVGLRNTLSLAWFLNPDARFGFLADP
eukprot:3958786-Amphidinium_carterae.1